jgi:nucleoside-diphosphate-sugar epimerase
MIIHNAWRLDFNLSLASFEPNVKATRNLVDLALDSHYSSSLRFVFTSSIGSAQSWDRERGAFPEEVLFDPSPAVGPGYGEAKYVCGRVRRAIYSTKMCRPPTFITLGHRQKRSPRDLVAHWPDHRRTERIVGNDELGTDYRQVKHRSWSLPYFPWSK